MRRDFVIRWSDAALLTVEKIQDRRIRQKLHERAGELTSDPDKRGKRMEDELKGLWAVRAVGQRYRILYQIDVEKQVVMIATLGIRKDGSKDDVYVLAEKLLRQGLIKVKL